MDRALGSFLLTMICIIGLFAVFDAIFKEYEKRQSETQVTSSSLESRTRETSGWTCWTVRGEKDKIFTSKWWVALRRLASRSKSKISDVEMQQVQTNTNSTVTAGIPALLLHPGRNTNHASRNSNLAYPINPNAVQDTTRLQSPAPLRSGRSSIQSVSRWAAATVGQSLRETPEQREQRAVEPSLANGTPAITSQPPTYSRMLPELDARPSLSESIIEVLGSEFLTPTTPQIPPPTYGNHTFDAIVYSSDYENTIHPTEGIGDTRGLPPHALSWILPPDAMVLQQVENEQARWHTSTETDYSA